jgi:hypothetical protein
MRIPKNVLEKFSQIFPDAERVEWTKKRSQFRADFIYHDLNTSVTFDGRGDVVKATQEILSEQLPENISKRLVEEFSEYKILVVLERFVHRKHEYEIEIMKGSFHYILQFNEKGRLTDQFKLDRISTVELPSN